MCVPQDLEWDDVHPAGESRQPSGAQANALVVTDVTGIVSSALTIIVLATRAFD